MFGLTNFCNHLVDKCDDGLVDIMCLVDSLDHLVFRDLIGTGFDHDDLLCCRCNGQFQISVVPLCL